MIGTSLGSGILSVFKVTGKDWGCANLWFERTLCIVELKSVV